MEDLRAAYSEGRLNDAWALYRQLEARGEAGPEMHFLGARAAQGCGDLLAARMAIDKAVPGGASGALLGQIRFAAGIIYLRLGDVHMAADQFRSFLAGGAEYPQIYAVAEGSAWFNLALALRQAKQFAAAVDAYQRAAAAHRVNSLLNSLCETLHNLAWTACMINDRLLAREVLDEASPLCSTDHLRRHQRLGEAFVGILGAQEDQRRAIEVCRDMMSDHGDIPHHVRSHACWLAGRVALERGQWDQAEQLAYQAVHYGSLDRSESRCLSDAAELLRSVRAARLHTGA